jgi:DNA-binding CsgD family transcriptional regulator
MHLSLTAHDRTRLQTAQETLLSPLDFDTVDAWRSAANDAVKALLGADKALFQMPEVDGVRVYSDEYEPGLVNQYLQRAQPLHERFAAWRRVATQGVWNRPTLWRSALDAYYRSAYYNEYVVLQRGYHGLGMSMTARDEVRPGSLVQLIVHHDNPRTEPFGARGLALLRLLYPAFKAGVEAWYRLAQHRNRLRDLLDELGAALRVSDLDGQTLHRTPALVRALRADPERDRLEAALDRVTQQLVRHMRGTAAPHERIDAPVRRSVATRVARYRISGTIIRRGAMGPQEVVLVTLDRARPAAWPLDALENRFDLTPRQAEVAQLLAQRKTNREIAEALCISRHTARHHTEAVLRKLGIQTRTEVRDSLHRHREAPW